MRLHPLFSPPLLPGWETCCNYYTLKQLHIDGVVDISDLVILRAQPFTMVVAVSTSVQLGTFEFVFHSFISPSFLPGWETCCNYYTLKQLHIDGVVDISDLVILRAQPFTMVVAVSTSVQLGTFEFVFHSFISPSFLPGWETCYNYNCI